MNDLKENVRMLKEKRKKRRQEELMAAFDKEI